MAKLAAALSCTVADLLTEPKPALIPAEELAQAEAELKDLEARIARLKAEVFPSPETGRTEAKADTQAHAIQHSHNPKPSPPTRKEA